MSEEFDIFNNLKKLKKVNFLAELKSKLAATENNVEGDDFDIDSLLGNNDNPRRPHKQSKKTDGKVKKNNKCKSNKVESTSPVKGTSVSSKGSKVENIDVNLEQPVARRSRRNLQVAQETVELICTPAKTNDNNAKPKRRSARGKRNSEESTNSAIPDVQTASNSAEDVSQVFTNDNNLTSRAQRRGTRRSNVMRARRTYLAEKAARSTQVDFIDLVTGPCARVEGFINLDSDEENSQSVLKVSEQEKINQISNTSFGDDNPEICVKIKWKGKPETFKVRKYEKFVNIFETLAQRENTHIEQILLNIENRIISKEDTPDSIDYKIYQFINGRVLANSFSSPLVNIGPPKERLKNRITLKIQSDKWKRPIEMDLLKTDKFRILYIKCSEELKVSVERLKLRFDGDILEFNDTPANLELEGNEIIDLCFKN